MDRNQIGHQQGAVQGFLGYPQLPGISSLSAEFHHNTDGLILADRILTQSSRGNPSSLNGDIMVYSGSRRNRRLPLILQSYALQNQTT